MRRFFSTLAALALGAAAGSCGGGSPAFGGPQPERYDRSKAEASLKALEKPGVVIGEFRLARNGVVDGDTIKVEGLDTTLRLLAIDTEEKFRVEEHKRQYEMGWDHYVKWSQGDSNKPAKYASPLGDEASKWAKDFFAGVEIVRLERDDPKDLRGRYGRYLTYVFAKKGGEWVNYNVECVRAGMSPYFMKYGYSTRFHDEFEAAMAEARAAKRGIWDPTKQHYPDYDARLAWWRTRGDFIAAFEEQAEGKSNYIELSHWDALKRIEEHDGKPIVLLGTVGSIKLGDRGPTRVMLSRRMNADFPLIFFDKDVFGSSGIERYKGEYITVQGTVNRYYNKYRKREELQIVVDLPSQITGPQLPWFEKTND